jgi:TP901 family phage tail tape measure protein
VAVADIRKTIEIVFGAVDNTGGAIKSLGDDISNMSGKIEAATKPFADARKAIVDIELAALAAGVAIGGLAIAEFGAFNSKITETGTLFNATEDQVSKLRDEVFEFAQTSTSDIGTITQSLYDAVSATGDWENAVKFLADAEKLAVAGSSNLGAATNLLTTALNAYGASSTEAERYSDALFVTVQNGKTTIDELEASLGRVAAAAAASNMPIETVGAALAALTGVVGNTGQSTTMLAALLKELSKPGPALQEALGGLSLEADGLVPILERLKEVTGGSQAEMNKLFGSIEASNGALILANDNAGTFAKTLDGMEDKAGVVAKAYTAMSNEFEAINQRLANNVRLSLIALGGEITEGYGALIGGATALFQSLANSIKKDDSLKPLTDYVNAKATEAGGYLSGMAEALPEALKGVDFDELTKSFDKLFDAVGGLFGALFGDIDLTKPKDLQKAIQAVVDALTNFNLLAAQIATEWQPSFKVFGDLGAKFLELDADALELIGSLIGIGDQINLWSGIFGGAGSALSTLGDLIVIFAGAKFLGLIPGAAALAAGALGAAKGGLLAAILALEWQLINGTPIGDTIRDWLAPDAIFGEDATLADVFVVIADEWQHLVKTVAGNGIVAPPFDPTAFNSGMSNLIKSLQDSIKEGDDFEEALAKLEKKTDLTGVSIDGLRIAFNNLKDSMETAGDASGKLEKDIGKLSIDDVKKKAVELGISLDDLSAYLKEAERNSISMEDAVNDLSAALAEGLSAKEATAAIKGLNDAVENYSKTTKDLLGDLDKNQEEFGRMAYNVDDAKKNLEQLEVAIKNATEAFGADSEQVAELKDRYAEQVAEMDAMRNGAYGVEASVESLSLQVNVLGNSTDTTNEKLKNAKGELTEMQKAAIETERQLNELASNEKIKAMEFTANIRVAEIEAEAKQVVAAFESIGETIAALAGQTDALMTAWSGAESMRDKWTAEEWINRNLDMQEAALKKQGELIDAQIKLIEERTEALKKGDALIKIESDGLEPFLEAFMWEILKRIQTRVNEDGLELLLGV